MVSHNLCKNLGIHLRTSIFITSDGFNTGIAHIN